MVAEIAAGDTTQWEVFDWAFDQAQFMSPTQHHVLLYLAGHAFYQANNPEKGHVGQVLREASYVDSIGEGTGLRRDAIRRALNALQRGGYLQRETRKDPGIHGQQPHLIYLLWESAGEVLRQGLRDGTLRLPPELMTIPTRRRPRPVLTVVREVCDESAL